MTMTARLTVGIAAGTLLGVAAGTVIAWLEFLKSGEAEVDW